MKRSKPHSKLHVLALAVVGLGTTVALAAPANPAGTPAVPPVALKGAGVGQEQREAERRLREAERAQAAKERAEAAKLAAEKREQARRERAQAAAEKAVAKAEKEVAAAKADKAAADKTAAEAKARFESDQALAAKAAESSKQADAALAAATTAEQTAKQTLAKAESSPADASKKAAVQEAKKALATARADRDKAKADAAAKTSASQKAQRALAASQAADAKARQSAEASARALAQAEGKRDAATQTLAGAAEAAKLAAEKREQAQREREQAEQRAQERARQLEAEKRRAAAEKAAAKAEKEIAAAKADKAAADKTAADAKARFESDQALATKAAESSKQADAALAAAITAEQTAKQTLAKAESEQAASEKSLKAASGAASGAASAASKAKADLAKAAAALESATAIVVKDPKNKAAADAKAAKVAAAEKRVADAKAAETAAAAKWETAAESEKAAATADASKKAAVQEAKKALATARADRDKAKADAAAKTSASKKAQRALAASQAADAKARQSAEASARALAQAEGKRDAAQTLAGAADAAPKDKTRAPRLVVPEQPPAPPADPIPEGGEWLYEVRFSTPANCGAFLEGLRDNLPQLASPPPAKGAPAPEVSSLGDLLAKGRTSIVGDTLFVRDAKGRTVNQATIRGTVSNLLDRTVGSGFYIATLMEEPATITNGVLGVKLDPGRIGRVNMAFKESAAQTDAAAPAKPADGRYFSREQIMRRFDSLKTGRPFDYNLLYDGVYTANAHPDLVVNADLRVRPEVENDRRWRYVDIDLEVEESLPFHAVLDVSNYGTEASDNWEAGLTLQHLNLTKHDDVLTVNAQSAFDGSLYSVAGSYYLPHDFYKGGGLTAYGGYSDLSVDEVVPSIDVEGTGWFAGLQYSSLLVDNDRHKFSLAFGKVHRYIEDQLIVGDVDTEPRDVTVAPFSLSAIYSSKPSRDWGGRLYCTLELLYNVGDFLGSSDEEEIQRLRREAEADYFIARPSVAYVQTFGGAGAAAKGGEGRWVLFLRASGQYADGPLVPAEQLGVGGANTVRGYVEREFLGDHGAFANIELRTPMLLGFLTRPFASPEHRKAHLRNPLDRLQLVAFFDAGTIKIEDALPGEDDSQSLYSAGVGLRFAFTEYAQLKFDWGFPLEETDESSSSGRGHINLQLQF
jgi:hemolysin activation/secretion protein